jgi:hypothetical protein
VVGGCEIDRIVGKVWQIIGDNAMDFIGKVKNMFRLKSSNDNVVGKLYLGDGKGLTIENAVIINTASRQIGIPAEYAYIESKHGKMNLHWTTVKQSLLRVDEKKFDVIIIKLKGGQQMEYFFDITSFFGKSLGSNR